MYVWNSSLVTRVDYGSFIDNLCCPDGNANLIKLVRLGWCNQHTLKIHNDNSTYENDYDDNYFFPRLYEPLDKKVFSKELNQ